MPAWKRENKTMKKETASKHQLGGALDGQDNIVSLADGLLRVINGFLVGHAAIEYAEENDLLLNKFADPTEDARKGLTVNEAREIAREDDGLIWVRGATMIPALRSTRLSSLASVNQQPGVNHMQKLNYLVHEQDVSGPGADMEYVDQDFSTLAKAKAYADRAGASIIDGFEHEHVAEVWEKTANGWEQTYPKG